MPGKPPLGLHAEVTLATGATKRWDSGARAAGDRPQGISFRTKKGDGFADAQLTLSRRIDQDYVDLNLYDDFALVGFDGSVAYEGRVAALPRTLSEQSHQVGVVLQGWMSHAKDRKFSEIYVDRDISKWRGPSIGRQASIAALSADVDPAQTAPDVSDGLAALNLQMTGAWARQHYVEGWYDAGPGLTAGAAYYSALQNSLLSLADNNWSLSLWSGTGDGSTASFTNVTGDLIPGTGAFASNNTYVTLATPQRFLLWQLSYAVAAGGAGQNYSVFMRKPAVYGAHGLTRRGLDPGGFYASDVITNVVQRFCPRLNTAGVQATTYAIPHLVFDRAFPYDAFLEVNKFHLWNLAVYEKKTLYFQPFDYTDYDWEVRRSDPGVSADLQGDSVGEFFNGIVVTYDDVDTGHTTTITPDDDATLLDTSVTNPANVHGLKVWTETTISAPTTALGAVNHARAVLAETNQPKAPGTIRIEGHVRDRAGHWQQVWKIRAGDRIIISDHPNDAVRIVGESDYNHDSKTVSIAVDQSFMRIDAVQDRVTTALQAANLI